MDDIGKMDNACQHCGLLKFLKETASTCCNNGKVDLLTLPQPPDQINELWREDTAEGRSFRQHARSINNAVCLTSIKGKQKTLGVDSRHALSTKERCLTWSDRFKQQMKKGPDSLSCTCTIQVWRLACG